MKACEQQRDRSRTVLQEHHHEQILHDMVAPKWAKSWWGGRFCDKGEHGLTVWEEGCKKGFPQSDLFLALITLLFLYPLEQNQIFVP